MSGQPTRISTDAEVSDDLHLTRPRDATMATISLAFILIILVLLLHQILAEVFSPPGDSGVETTEPSVQDGATATADRALALLDTSIIGSVAVVDYVIPVIVALVVGLLAISLINPSNNIPGFDSARQLSALLGLLVSGGLLAWEILLVIKLATVWFGERSAADPALVATSIIVLPFIVLSSVIGRYTLDSPEKRLVSAENRVHRLDRELSEFSTTGRGTQTANAERWSEQRQQRRPGAGGDNRHHTDTTDEHLSTLVGERRRLRLELAFRGWIVPGTVIIALVFVMLYPAHHTNDHPATFILTLVFFLVPTLLFVDIWARFSAQPSGPLWLDPWGTVRRRATALGKTVRAALITITILLTIALLPLGILQVSDLTSVSPARAGSTSLLCVGAVLLHWCRIHRNARNRRSPWVKSIVVTRRIDSVYADKARTALAEQLSRENSTGEASTPSTRGTMNRHARPVGRRRAYDPVTRRARHSRHRRRQ